jgi:hypothetical protein
VDIFDLDIFTIVFGTLGAMCLVKLAMLFSCAFLFNC